MSDDLKRDHRKELIECSEAAFEKEYSELSDTWRALDGKAQGVIAVAGIFLAGALAFARGLSDASGKCEKTFLTITIVLFSISVVLALICLLTRTLPHSPPWGEEFENIMGIDLVNSGEVGKSKYISAWAHLKEKWQKANSAVIDINTSKAALVYWAQLLLVVGVVCAAIVSGISIWR